MKKLDKLILLAFIGPFILTLLVVIFILLSRQMLYYFDDIIGKDLGLIVLGKFICYFILIIIPVALPLAVLLSSLITFGNLAEHFELSAIKSAGISLLRVIRPIFLFTVFLTVIAFFSNNNLAPYAALEAYTLLYDIKQKKPALDIREDTFYNGLPDVSIKVDQKFSEDPAALKKVILYDHRAKDSEDVFVADSGRMYTILNDRYMKFELYKGYNYKEDPSQEKELTGRKTIPREALSKSAFTKLEIVFDLSSFDLTRTSKHLFEGNKLMRNLKQLDGDIDSLNRKLNNQVSGDNALTSGFFVKPYAFSPSEKQHDTSAWDTLLNAKPTLAMLQATTNHARQIKNSLGIEQAFRDELEKSRVLFEMQWHKIIANSLACIAMFLIGAPLGAIIKKGGLGIPFLVSIAFFIFYTLVGMQGEKLAGRGIVPVQIAAWAANGILLITGLLFLRTAQRDGRLFDFDLDRQLGRLIRGKFLRSSN
jgi:lipopolysaccharide export system permease protein